MTLTLEERFWKKVKVTDGCWLWVGAVGSGGYGNFFVGPHWEQAHRVGYRLQVGPIPDGLMVCHRCDVRLCVKGTDVFVGTNADNLGDMARKGRQRNGVLLGARNHKTKLTAEAVLEVRQRCAAGGVSILSLAHEHGVSWPAMNAVLRGQAWAHTLTDLTELERTVLAGRFRG